MKEFDVIAPFEFKNKAQWEKIVKIRRFFFPDTAKFAYEHSLATVDIHNFEESFPREINLYWFGAYTNMNLSVSEAGVKKIEKLRTKMHITQSQIASACETYPSRISRMLRGEIAFDVDVLMYIMTRLNLTYEDIS